MTWTSFTNEDLWAPFDFQCCSTSARIFFSVASDVFLPGYQAVSRTAKSRLRLLFVPIWFCV